MAMKRVRDMTDDEVRDLCGSRDVPEHAARDAADRVAEAVRLLNYLSLPGDGAPGLTWPADAYDVIGGLRRAAGMIPQMNSQLAGWLMAEQEAGRVAHESGGDALEAVQLTCDWLGMATEGAVDMETFYRHAHNASSVLKAAG
jgi:hypothetical protein